MNTIFVFDIETIPDTRNGRKIHHLSGSDAEVAEAMFELRRAETGGSDFLRLHLHQIVAISVVLRTRDQLKVWSLGDLASTEAELISRFFDGIDKYQPTLVSWNGCCFDLPVLHYRALLHGIAAHRYWETGDNDASYRWNNYLNRYHYRHMDIMDILAAYQARANAPLDEIATMLGLPGKMGMHGSKVWDNYLQGDLASIRNYCETDVLNTYLVFLRVELMRGRFDKIQYEQECERVKQLLSQSPKAHLQAFLQEWQQGDGNSSEDCQEACLLSAL